jgi:hypothetical protein
VAVRVAVHIRPLVEQELAKGCQEILDVSPGQPQVGDITALKQRMPLQTAQLEAYATH